MFGLVASPFAMIETFVAFVLALILHNCAQALMAAALGDRTPVNKGRFSFLPGAHLSAIGVIVAIVTSISAACGLGWGKPVETDAPRLRPGPNVGIIIVALTGMITNFVIGLGIAFGLKFLPGVPALERAWADCSQQVGNPLLVCLNGAQPAWLLYIMQFLIAFAVTNVGLALLNIIPLYPLDGYYILFAILPSGPAITYRNTIQYMELILLLILFLIPYLLQILQIHFDPALIIGNLARSLVFRVGSPAFSYYLAL
ncbi:MAG TPA: site-2 protease family protein [Ktedonobacterales bacterium]|nr:site-2 protease family protein [Ktedonobacterales bacterium]